MSQMNVTPSEQQSMEIAASALAMEALYKDGSSKGVRNGGINKNMVASVKALVQQYTATSTGKTKEKEKNTRSLPR
jgi:hypothetical protein